MLRYLCILLLFPGLAYAQSRGGSGIYTQTGLNIIGPGSTTFAYLDWYGKPCGTGMKSSGYYPLDVLPPEGTPTTGLITASISANTMTVTGQAWTGTLGVDIAISGAGVPYNTWITAVNGGGAYTLNTSSTVASETMTAAVFTMGDMPDPDINDPLICTVAQWQAKWGWTAPETSANRAANNLAMANFLAAEKGFTNTTNVYYAAPASNPPNGSPAGSDTACLNGSGNAAPNEPDIPCASLAPIMSALAVTSTTFTGTATIVNNSPYITVSGTCSGSGTLVGGTKVIGTSIPNNDYVQQQIAVASGKTAAGCDGIYLLTIAATANATEAISGTQVIGGVVVMRGGLSPNFLPQAPNPGWDWSGTQSQPLLVMAYPGEEVLDVTSNSRGQIYIGSESIYACFVTFDGIQFMSSTYGGPDGAVLVSACNFTWINDEFAGFDDAIQTGDPTWNLLVTRSVMHDVDFHGVYYSLGNAPFGASITTVAGSNILRLNTALTGIDKAEILGSSLYDGQVLIPGIQGCSDPITVCGVTNYTYIENLASGTLGAVGSTYVMGGANGGNALASGTETVPGTAFQRGYGYGGQINPPFSYALDQQNVINGASPGASYNDRAVDNVLYGVGNSGYEPIHFNDELDGGLIAGNIVAYSGGGCATEQSAISNIPITGNLCFLNSGECLLTFLNRGTIITGIVNATITYNVCFESQGSDNIRGGSPGEGIEQFNPPLNGTNHFIKSSLIANNVVVTTAHAFIDWESSSWPETNLLNNNIFWNAGVGGPASAMIVSSDASPCAASNNGTYAFSSIATYRCFASPPSGNTYAASNPFAAANESYLTTPGLFNFAPYNLR